MKRHSYLALGLMILLLPNQGLAWNPFSMFNDVVKSVASKVGDVAQQATKAVTDTVDDAAQHVKKAATTVGNAVKDTAVNVAQQAAKTVKDTAVDAARQVGKSAMALGNTVKNTAVVQQVTKAATTVGKAVKDSAIAVKNTAVGTAKTVASIAKTTGQVAQKVGSLTANAATSIGTSLKNKMDTAASYAKALFDKDTPWAECARGYVLCKDDPELSPDNRQRFFVEQSFNMKAGKCEPFAGGRHPLQQAINGCKDWGGVDRIVMPTKVAGKAGAALRGATAIGGMIASMSGNPIGKAVGQVVNILGGSIAQ